MTGLTLPEIYRKAAELVLADGKIEGGYVDTNEERDECYGFCTMGAVFRASGDMTDDYDIPSEFDGSDAQTRLMKPIAETIVSSGRGVGSFGRNENEDSWFIIQAWNDRSEDRPTAEDVAALLRQTADSVEVAA